MAIAQGGANDIGDLGMLFRFVQLEDEFADVERIALFRGEKLIPVDRGAWFVGRRPDFLASSGEGGMRIAIRRNRRGTG